MNRLSFTLRRSVPAFAFALSSLFFASAKAELTVFQNHEISFENLPRDHQIYPRDLETNRAKVSISGTLSGETFDKITLSIHRNNKSFSELSQTLNYRNGTAAFSFAPEITAELASYDFELFLEQNGKRESIRKIQDVAAGDAFLFYGQSNAEAQKRGQRSANEYASRWLRTFGQNGDSGKIAENSLDWIQAEGDGRAEDPGSIGQWAMVLGKKLIDTEQIPIAILNGSRGAYSMKKLQKDRSQPDNLYDSENQPRTYNRLRYRAIQAGIADSARAIFFYQGEGDGNNAELHADGFARMREDWENDYPGLEHFYIVQVRPGCEGAITVEDVGLRDTQRRFADEYPNTSIMSANGLGTHDGCHFGFTDGYEDLGWHHFRQVSRDLYNGSSNPNIDALNPLFAEFTDESRQTIRLVLRNRGAAIHFPEEALADFALNDSPEILIGRTVETNAILFHLAGPAPKNSRLEYRSHIGPGPAVTNDYGVGLLTFSEPVIPFHFLGLPDGGKKSSWLGNFEKIEENPDGTLWIFHEEHGWLYTLEQKNLTGVWLWDHEQQDWLWTKAAVYPLLYRHNDNNGYWLYYGGKSANSNKRNFYDYRSESWFTVP